MVWFHRYIPVYHVLRGELREFWSFEELLTPLWFWEE
jgi:hypothetical protein